MLLRRISLAALLTAIACGMLTIPAESNDETLRAPSNGETIIAEPNDLARRIATIAVYDAQRDAVGAALADFVGRLKSEGWTVEDESSVKGGSGEWRYQVVVTATKPDVPPSICYVEVMGFVSHDEHDSPTWFANLPMRLSSRGNRLDEQFLALFIPRLDAKAWSYNEEKVVHRIDEFPALTPIVMQTRQRERLLKFYRTLAVDFVPKKYGAGPLHHTARIGSKAYEIHTVSETEAVDATTRLSFRVDKLAETIETLRAAGTPIESEPKPSRWGYRFSRGGDDGDDLGEPIPNSSLVDKYAIVRDPDGRTVQINGY